MFVSLLSTVYNNWTNCASPDCRIHFLYASTRVIGEVNCVRTKPFTLSRSICKGCLLLLMLYVLALKPFLHKFRWNAALHKLTQCSATSSARYSTYADNVSVCNKYCRGSGCQQRNQKVWGHVSSVSSVKSRWVCRWVLGPYKILIWYGPDIQLEKNLSEA